MFTATDNIAQSIQVLSELAQEQGVPKSVQIRILGITKILEEPNGEPSIRVNRALNALEELADENHLPSFARSQVFSVLGLLAAVH